MRTAPVIELDSGERQRLEKVARSNTASVREARRAAIVLRAADGLTNQEIAEELGVGRVQVGRWRKRYSEGGLGAIVQDLPRGGRKPAADAEEVVRLTTQTPANATHWSTRSLARVMGTSPSTSLPTKIVGDIITLNVRSLFHRDAQGSGGRQNGPRRFSASS